MPKKHFFVFLKSSSFPPKRAKHIVSTRKSGQQTGLKAKKYSEQIENNSKIGFGGIFLVFSAKKGSQPLFRNPAGNP